jgi:hypothetical protein
MQVRAKGIRRTYLLSSRPPQSLLRVKLPGEDSGPLRASEVAGYSSARLAIAAQFTICPQTHPPC